LEILRLVNRNLEDTCGPEKARSNHCQNKSQRSIPTLEDKQKKQEATGWKDLLSWSNNELKIKADTGNILQSIAPQRPNKECVDGQEQQQTSCDRYYFKKGNESCTDK
jgi:hypothetical protein